MGNNRNKYNLKRLEKEYALHMILQVITEFILFVFCLFFYDNAQKLPIFSSWQKHFLFLLSVSVFLVLSSISLILFHFFRKILVREKAKEELYQVYKKIIPFYSEIFVYEDMKKEMISGKLGMLDTLTTMDTEWHIYANARMRLILSEIGETRLCKLLSVLGVKQPHTMVQTWLADGNNVGKDISDLLNLQKK